MPADQNVLVPSLMHRLPVESLLSTVTAGPNQASSLQERRQLLLKLLVELLDANVGHWAWGYGDVVTNGLLPVAIIVEGYRPDQLTLFSQMGLDTELMHPFRSKIYELMGGNHHSTVVRSDIFEDAAWLKSGMRASLQQMGLNEWVHCVRYQSANVWSNMMLVRNSDRAGFTVEDALLLDVAMKSISWLHATAEECVSKELLVGLTDRQRLVTLLVLDGIPRKLIASKLGIAEDTVGDHLKSIYRHFKVTSATELAAIFLKSK